MQIISSSYETGAVQASGKNRIRETHTTDTGMIDTFDYDAFIDPNHPEYVDPQAVMDARAARLNAEYAAKARAFAIAEVGGISYNKYEFRRLFSADERPGIDAFIEGGYLTHPALSEAQKTAVGDGVRAYQVTPSVHLDNADTVAMVSLFEALGLIATGRAAEVLSGQVPA